ncbi:hypothetical protein RB595_006749 [Gaeumannomyces hyphopodioides]
MATTTTNTTAPAKDRITCHILDTTAGRPARGVRVRLELTPPSAASFAPTAPSSGAASSPSPAAVAHHGQHGGAGATARTFESQTDDDGRVKAWLPFSGSNDSGEVPIYTLDDVLGEVEATATGAGSSRWTLRFDSAGYFGDAGTFFPEVAVVFEVQRGQHYHVPLLLSPYGYTTYRGS